MAFLSPALAKLRAEVDAMSPDRSRVSDGWIGDPAHQSRPSDHNPEADGSVDAIDITHDPAHGVDCNLLADQVKDDRRVSYVIWNRRIWNPSISRTWRAYSGSNPHDKHMHVSVTDAGQNDTSGWLEEVDELSAQDVKEIKAAVDRAADRIVDAVKAGNRAQTRALRRAVWTAQGKTVAEIEELESKLPAD